MNPTEYLAKLAADGLISPKLLRLQANPVGNCKTCDRGLEDGECFSCKEYSHLKLTSGRPDSNLNGSPHISAITASMRAWQPVRR
jgi:hypothetical protein